MLRRFLSLFGLCPHAHDRRERDAAGRLWLVCEGCERRVLAIQRTPKEIKAMRKQFKPVTARKAQSSARPRVAAMTGRGR